MFEFTQISPLSVACVDKGGNKGFVIFLERSCTVTNTVGQRQSLGLLSFHLQHILFDDYGDSSKNLEADNDEVPGPMVCAPPKATQGRKSEENNMQLKMNKNITKSEAAQRLAWKSFSATERDRIDRGREAMMESGLIVDDLNSEQRGTKNGLPEWRKKNTGKFAREKRNAI
ncbi:hypothetical protein SNOG_08108 [Parastagonospora nodorum SN15]|uniref:Uncharacterized protein n=1 Tax=Phaeosphaeria nodorum (strain SN15 / ATCC MYA-4574 / FGSC 10173) TaxID=321614 RepID=Q0UJF6_PHANO|nr:hypothetical protein SNOG_08108 [Parastagonospora nodorum SN15]EAT84384.2 hypothetical protein SNOG_08108 [Parastagonospora nodorum SN15]